MITPYSEVSEALDADDLLRARKLLARYANKLSRDDKNELLREAAAADKVAAMQLLVEFGADVNASQLNGSPEGPIWNAASNGAVNAVRWLAEHGAKVNHIYC